MTVTYRMPYHNASDTAAAMDSGCTILLRLCSSLARGRKEAAMANALIISSDSHVFEPPDLWTTRIDAAFRERAPRMQRVGEVDQLVVEGQQAIAGIGLISNAGARF